MILETTGVAVAVGFVCILVASRTIYQSFFGFRESVQGKGLVGGENEALIKNEAGETVIKEIESHSEDHNGGLSFRSFQFRFLLVYSLGFMSDLIGSPYTFSMFSDYVQLKEKDINLLMQLPFLASALTCLLVSPIVDTYGRRKGTILAMILYVLRYLLVFLCPKLKLKRYGCCVLAQFFWGVGVALLYSVPESWMVDEHKKRKFQNSKLSGTFSKAYLINSLAGVCIILVARMVRVTSSNNQGIGLVLLIGAALALLAAVTALMLWSENTGEKVTTTDGSQSSKRPLALSLLIFGVTTTFSSLQIMATGLHQAAQDGACWVFLAFWTPVLQTQEYEYVLTAYLLFQAAGAAAVPLICTEQDTNESILGLQKREGREYKLSLRGTLLLYQLILLIGYIFSFKSKNRIQFYISNCLIEFGLGFHFTVFGNYKGLIIPQTSRVIIVSLFSLPSSLITYLIVKLFNNWHSQKLFIIAIFFEIFAIIVMAIAWIHAKRNRLRKSNSITAWPTLYET